MKVKVATNPEGLRRLQAMLKEVHISHKDLGGQILVRLGQLHRKQMARVFASQGAEGGSGRWPKLSPGYAAWKRRYFPGRRILVLSGEMKARFTTPSRPEYVQRFLPRGSGGVYQFGAYDEIAARHVKGGDTLPKRDMISKTAAQIAEFSASIEEWWRKVRVPQVRRAIDRLVARSRPGGV